MPTADPTSDQPTPEASLEAALLELSAATGQLLAAARKITESSLAAPSRLPGWSRGHVLTHLARNADGLTRLLVGLRNGVQAEMYDSAEARDRDIESGARREPQAQIVDLESSAGRFADEAAQLPRDLLTVAVPLGLSRVPVPAHQLPLIRIREVLIHHVDLGVGFGPDDWPEAFAVRTLDQVSTFFREQRSMPVGRLVDPDLGRIWTVSTSDLALTGSATALAAWLVGRSAGPDLEMSDGTAVPSAPAWV